MEPVGFVTSKIILSQEYVEIFHALSSNAEQIFFNQLVDVRLIALLFVYA